MKSSNTNSTPLLLTVLLLAVLAALYYFLVMPKTEEVSNAESAVANLQSTNASLQQQIDVLNSEQQTSETNEFVIRKKLPDQRAIDQLLLNIEEIEYVTGSRILAVSFNNYDALVNSSGYVDPNTPPQAENTDSTATPATDANAQAGEMATTAGQPTAVNTTGTESNEGEAASETNQVATGPELPITTIDALTLPANLKMVTFDVDIEAPNEQQLMLFLKEIEKLERVMHVDAIDFALTGEENDFAEDGSDIVSTTVQVTTFYYE